MADEHPAPGRYGAAPDLGIPGIEGLTQVGHGGFAVVYRARQPAFNRTVAIKVLSRVQLDPAAIRRFERERAALGTLSGHPNIVTVHDSGLTSDGIPYLVMEFLPLGSYAERLIEDGPVPWTEAVATGVRLAGALETAHRAGVLHRDVKPENVLRSSFGEAKLADFGIARVVAGPETQSGRLELSVLHSPPEIIDGRPPSASSDVYSLASTLYALIRGHSPFYDPEDDSLVRLLNRIAVEPPPDLDSAGVPPQVAAVIEQALAKDASRRHDSAAAVGRALQNAQAELGLEMTPLPVEGLSAMPPSRPSTAIGAPASDETPVAEVASPHRLAAALGALTALAIAIAGLAGWLLLRHPSHSAVKATTATTAAAPVTTAPTTAPPAVALPQSGSLSPGRYHTNAFLPGLEMTLGSGWGIYSAEDVGSFELRRGPNLTDPSFGIYRVDKVVDPSASPADASQIGKAWRPRPADLVAWFEHNQRLRTVRASQTQLGNTPGTEIDFSVASAYAEADCTAQCVFLFETGKTAVAVFAGSLNRCYIFALRGQPYVALASASSDVFSGFAATTERVLSTMRVPGAT
ncbi:MAG TPA: serine/threonine-protein kinase [Nocardioides sp.]|nr:serine/threonine-protein kinase [Nocardioides sp.]